MGDTSFSLADTHHTPTPPPPAPAPGIIISIIGVPFLQKDISPRVPKTEGVLGHFLGGPPPLHPWLISKTESQTKVLPSTEGALVI